MLTLIPLPRVRSVAFDGEKSTLTVKAAACDRPGDEVTLEGTTAYKGINKVTLQAEVDRGAAGVAAYTYQGGVLKGGIRELRFPAAKVEAEKPGRPAVVRTRDKSVELTHVVWDLQPLYLVAGQEKLGDSLFFHKTLKLGMAGLRKIAANDEDGDDLVWQVTQKDGEDATLTLLEKCKLDGQDAQLVALAGRVNVGWKLIPVTQVREILFDTSEAPAAKEEEKPVKKRPKAKEDPCAG